MLSLIYNKKVSCGGWSWGGEGFSVVVKIESEVIIKSILNVK